MGLAFADTTLRVLEVCEFDENDKFSNFESVLVQRSAKECLLTIDTGITPGKSSGCLAFL
jgi:DNA mismatch repair protein MSH2